MSKSMEIAKEKKGAFCSLLNNKRVWDVTKMPTFGFSSFDTMGPTWFRQQATVIM